MSSERKRLATQSAQHVAEASGSLEIGRATIRRLDCVILSGLLTLEVLSIQGDEAKVHGTPCPRLGPTQPST